MASPWGLLFSRGNEPSWDTHEGFCNCNFQMKEHPGPPSFLVSLSWKEPARLPSTDPWEPAGSLRGQPVPTDGTTEKCQVLQVLTSSAMLGTA